jgi:hypothetical protein
LRIYRRCNKRNEKIARKDEKYSPSLLVLQ